MSERVRKIRKYEVLFVCFVLSLLSWFMLKMSANYSATYKLDVVFTNLPENKKLSYMSDSLLTVTFEDKGISLFPIELSSKRLLIDYDVITSSYQKKYNHICLQEKQLTQYIKKQKPFSEHIKSIHPDRICIHLKNIEE